MKIHIQLFTFIFLFSLSSCTSIFYGIYGIKEPKVIAQHQLTKTASKRFNIDTKNLIILDSSYKLFCTNNYLPDTSSFNLALQPLQLRIYKNDTLVAFQANCNVGGFPNLNWERDRYFNTIPATHHTLKNAPLLKNELLAMRSALPPSENYVVLVFYTNFMHRQSKRLIKFAERLQQLHPDKKFRYMYVNGEEIFY